VLAPKKEDVRLLLVELELLLTLLPELGLPLSETGP